MFCEEYERNLGGISERYRCRDCGSKFVHRPGFLGKHYNDEDISTAINDRVTGKSLADAARSIQNDSHLGIKKRVPSRSTVLYWERYAEKLTSQILKKLPIRTSDRWATDELYYRSCGNGRYLFGIMDTESRFILANETCKSGDKLNHDPTNMFKQAINIAKKVPQVLISDRLKGFTHAFKNTIHHKKYRKKNKRPVHIRSAAVQKIHINNNTYERWNGTIRDRIKTVRGFNSEHPALLWLYITYYNFIRTHMGINNKTPAEVMGIRINGDNKWMTLLAFASVC